jgi:hypothetical protein
MELFAAWVFRKERLNGRMSGGGGEGVFESI